MGKKVKAPDYTPLAKAYDKAAVLQSKATKRAQDIQENQFNESLKRLAPWYNSGKWAINELRAGIQSEDKRFVQEWKGFDKDDLNNHPAYDYMREEGQRAIRRNLGGVSGRGGATMKALQKQGIDLANMNYESVRKFAMEDHQLKRQAKLDDYNQLSVMADRGQQQSQTETSLRMDFADMYGDLGVQGAAVRGQGMISGAQSMIQQEHERNRARQQNFTNTMSILGLGVGVAGGLYPKGLQG